jgi:hypothetical protein
VDVGVAGTVRMGERPDVLSNPPTKAAPPAAQASPIRATAPAMKRCNASFRNGRVLVMTSIVFG